MKIGDEAVAAFREANNLRPNVPPDSERAAWVRRGLEAAAPHLTPATPTQAELADWLRDIFSNDADPEGTTWEVAAEELQALLALHADGSVGAP